MEANKLKKDIIHIFKERYNIYRMFKYSLRKVQRIDIYNSICNIPFSRYICYIIMSYIHNIKDIDHIYHNLHKYIN